MKAGKTKEMLELYVAPTCMAVETSINRAIMLESGQLFNVNDLIEEDWSEIE